MAGDRPRAPFELPPDLAALPPQLPVLEQLAKQLLPPGRPKAARLERVPPHVPLRVRPLDTASEHVALWFTLMQATADTKGGEGLSAKQVVRQLGLERQASAIEAALVHMALAGDLVRHGLHTPRYASRRLERVLAAHLRHARAAATDAMREWAEFELAVMAYEDHSTQRHWGVLCDAFGLLIASLPGWPEAVVLEAQARAVCWLPRVAGVLPPPHLMEHDELVALRHANAELQAQTERLAEQLRTRPVPVVVASDGGKKAELRRRVDALEEENLALLARCEEQELELEVLELELEALSGPANTALADAFLEKKGAGPLPHTLGEAELGRLRELVLETRATRDIQRALVAKLAEIFQAPQSFQKLSSRAFTDTRHAFVTLHRARVGRYRIGYGLARKTPLVLAIGPRENFYAHFLRLVAASSLLFP